MDHWAAGALPSVTPPFCSPHTTFLSERAASHSEKERDSYRDAIRSVAAVQIRLAGVALARLTAH